METVNEVITIANVCADCLMYMEEGWLPFEEDYLNADIVDGCGGYEVLLSVDEVGARNPEGCVCCKNWGLWCFSVTLWDTLS